MGTLKNFQEITAWQKARILTKEIYKITGEGRFSRDFGLKDQIRKASVSIMSNIAEGFEREGRKEFIQFLSVAKASSGEVRSQLYVALDQGYIAKKVFEDLFELTDAIGRLLYGLMRYLRVSQIQGPKYRPLP